MNDKIIEMPQLDEWIYRHGETMRKYAFAKDIVDRPSQAITQDVMVAMADFIALFAQEKQEQEHE